MNHEAHEAARRSGFEVEAIYGSHPWTRAEGETVEGIHVRVTQNDSALYATLLGQPKTPTIPLRSICVRVPLGKLKLTKLRTLQ